MQTRLLPFALGAAVLLPLLLLVMVLVLYQPPYSLYSFSWIPSLDIALSFRFDGLSVLFAGLITGVGVLVQLYAVAYMKPYRGRGLFHLYLTLFMLSMLGLVLADNLLLIFVFWELTTVTSYLLIGFNHEEAVARRNALQAMLVTGAGGLSMLAGMILLGEIAGSYSMSVVLDRADMIATHPAFVASMVLIILGAFTKSAQYPFHFWLPGAMAAPTPVSAYLHSSTMVKAGVYLLARMLPIYGNTDIWFWTLTSVGAFTALWCAILAYRQTDLKLILAFSTNVILGQLVMLLGLGSVYAVTAALLLIAAHSFYKAGLFMVVGNIDKATGTREYNELAGLRSVLAISFLAALLTAASKAGLPPSLGFLSKEYLYKAGLEFHWVLAGVMLLVNALMVALSLLILIRPFLKPHHPEAAAIKPVEHNTFLWLSPIILAIASIVVPVALLGWYQHLIIDPAVSHMVPSHASKTVKLWQGFNIPLGLSFATLVVGVLLYRFYPTIKPIVTRVVDVFPTGPQIYQTLLDGIMAIARWQTRMLQHGALSGYTLQFFIVLVVVLGYGLSQGMQLPTPSINVQYYELVMAIFLVVAAFVVVLSRTLLLAVAALGTIGFLTTLVFLVYSAPDVAKTQLLVETLLVVFIAIVLRHIPSLHTVSRHSLPRKFVNGIVAGLVGLGVALVLWMITASPLDLSLSQFYAEQSLPGGHGRNIVNVILVDFRAFDTMGEIVVVVMAALATIALFGRSRPRLRKRV